MGSALALTLKRHFSERCRAGLCYSSTDSYSSESGLNFRLGDIAGSVPVDVCDFAWSHDLNQGNPLYAKDACDSLGRRSQGQHHLCPDICFFGLGYLSNEKNPVCLGYIRDYTTQLCGDSFINHYKDPY